MKIEAKCPICAKPARTKALQPFCSQRCADVDLSRWLKGGYVVPGASLDETEDAPPADPDNDV